MARNPFIRTLPAWLVLTLVAAHAACGSGNGGTETGVPISSASDGNATGMGGSSNDTQPSSGVLDGSGGSGFAQGAGTGGASAFNVTPAAEQTISVTAGQMTPPVTYQATLSGKPVSAGWSVDRGEIGTIPSTPSATAVFTPSGNVGGLVTVTAGLMQGKQTLTQTRQILVKLTSSQNGPNGSPSEVAQTATAGTPLTQGGGIGGVGGEGLGTAVTDMATTAAFKTPTDNGSAESLKFLYPYDKTVWPRGLLAPLLMWSSTLGNADAIQIRLHTLSGSYDWTGTFGRPAILTPTAAFTRHPIPQDVWEQATNSAGGVWNGGPDTLTVELTIAEAGKAYGPISETWPIAPARLSGIIYYNSYGTQLAKNYGGAKGGDGTFGGAVLSIHVGDTGPKLVAGANGNSSDCRVCHSVAATGTRLVVQHGDNSDLTTSAYDLAPTGATEHVEATGATFPAVYPDGSKVLSEGGRMLPLPDDTTPIAVTGLSAVTSDLGTPAFSPSGTLLAFNPMTGPVAKSPAQELMVMTFNPMTNGFSNSIVVADDTGQPADTRPGWPAFLPDGKSLVFHHQVKSGIDGNSKGEMYTRLGAKAEIAWTNVTDSQHVTALNQLNGKDATGTSYLPKLATPIVMSCQGVDDEVGNIDPDHGDDVDLNYEPTVNPIASGGYAWVVFTSRRLYGNVAVIPPFCSDPRDVDLIQNITPKKLWVAAIDLSAAPGKDASHPAFYLPAQELLAGNARGFWVLDPCKADGDGCMTGDECCNGFCEPGGDGGALVCTDKTISGSCSMPQEKCTQSADCCDATNECINGFCAQAGIK